MFMVILILQNPFPHCCGRVTPLACKGGARHGRDRGCNEGSGGIHFSDIIPILNDEPSFRDAVPRSEGLQPHPCRSATVKGDTGQVCRFRSHYRYRQHQSGWSRMSWSARSIQENRKRDKASVPGMVYGNFSGWRAPPLPVGMTCRVIVP
jgi:hypothetical protein